MSKDELLMKRYGVISRLRDLPVVQPLSTDIAVSVMLPRWNSSVGAHPNRVCGESESEAILYRDGEPHGKCRAKDAREFGLSVEVVP